MSGESMRGGIAPVPGTPGNTAGVPGSSDGVKPAGNLATKPPAAPRLGSAIAPSLGSFLGSGGKQMMPMALSALLSHPGIRNVAGSMFSVGGAPLMFGMADMGNGFKNMRTLTRGAGPQQ